MKQDIGRSRYIDFGVLSVPSTSGLRDETVLGGTWNQSNRFSVPSTSGLRDETYHYTLTNKELSNFSVPSTSGLRDETKQIKEGSMDKTYIFSTLNLGSTR